ncbi:MAG: sulfite exporter TauE/SafE family protein [Gammaproteobacteria bacterium]|nr:sulfite exporter TauE/SafE family protein [Gammaproteobacteria bacterium]
MEWLVYLITGAVAGVMAGLLGIGGGFVIVPALVFLLPQFGVDSAIVMHVAVGTSLATIVVTASSSLWAHHKRQGVNWVMFRRLSPGIVVGALLSGWLADQLATQWLALIFGCGAMLMSLQIVLAQQPQPRAQPPSFITQSLVATLFGSASGLVGIGGGSLVVPYLHYLGERMTVCIGTAASCGLPLALAGSISFAWAGSDAPVPQFSLGYIYLPAFLGIIIASTATAPLGAKLAHVLPAPLLKKIFAVFLAIVGAQIIIKSFG